MSYILKQNLIATSKYSIKCPYTMTPIGYCVHNTANDATAENEIKYMISNDKQVSFHYAVDDKYVVQGLLENRNGWHAGDGGNGNGNRKYIAIEICYSKSGGNKFIKAEENAALFIAKGLKEHGWGIDKVKKHQDFSNKYCPHRTLDMGWDRFLKMIQNELDKLNVSTEIYKVRKSWNDASSQIGAYTNLDNAKKACKQGYSVFNSKGEVVYTVAAPITHKWKIGQRVSFGTSYPSATTPCGIKYATSGAGDGIITAIVDGQAKYQIDKGKRYVNDGDITGLYTVTTATVSARPTTVTTSRSYEAGTKVTLTKVALYTNSTTTKISNTITGTYYLWDDTIENGRIRITNNPNRVGIKGQITGFVNVATINTSLTPTKPTTSTSSISNKLVKGSKCKIRSGAKQYGKNIGFASFVYKNTYDIIEVKKDSVVFGIGKTITGITAISNIIL